MEFETFIKVFFVCSLGAMSPGPSWVLVINNSLFKGKISGYVTSIGHGFGIACYAIIANISIGIIIEKNIFLFNSIKIISIIFLIYLGFKSIFSDSINIDEKKLSSKFKSFIEGFSLAILNPKVLIWFIAIYSQFMSPNNDTSFNLILILTAGIVDLSWYCLLVSLITTEGFLNFLKNRITTLQKIIGFMFILIGVMLMFLLSKSF